MVYSTSGILDKVYGIACIQKETPESSSPCISYRYGTPLLTVVKGNPKFQNLLVELRHEAREKRLTSNNPDAKKKFTGRIFRELAFWYMSSLLPPKVVIPPKETAEIYQVLHPSVPITPELFGFYSVGGISATSGIVVELYENDARIVAVCQYTTSDNKIYHQKKFDGFRNHKREFPQILEQSNLLFVTPRSTALSPKVRNQPDVKQEKMSFTSKEFRRFIDMIYPLVYA